MLLLVVLAVVVTRNKEEEMSRMYPISGAVTGEVAPATQAVNTASHGARPLVHGTATGTLSSRGRVFWLRGIWARPEASAHVLALADCSVGATAISDSAGNTARRIMFTAASAAAVGASTANKPAGVTKIDFPPPGVKFTTNCCVYVCGSTANLYGGTGASAGSVGGYGYEE